MPSPWRNKNWKSLGKQLHLQRAKCISGMYLACMRSCIASTTSKEKEGKKRERWNFFFYISKQYRQIRNAFIDLHVDLRGKNGPISNWKNNSKFIQLIICFLLLSCICFMCMTVLPLCIACVSSASRGQEGC